MAKSGTANLVVGSDTFLSWFTRTNLVSNELANYIVTANNEANGSLTTGNGFVIGTFGANTIVAPTGIRGGNVQTSNTLNVLSVLSVANTMSITGTLTGNTFLAGNSSINVTSNSTVLSVANATTNVQISVSTLAIGNSIANTIANSTVVSTANSISNVQVTPVSILIGNTTVNAVANSSTFKAANSTSNLVVTIPSAALWASGTAFLNANGSWTSVATSIGGSNAQALFNDSGTSNTSAGFTFNKTTNNAVIANTLTTTITQEANIQTLSISSGVVSWNVAAGRIAKITLNANTANIAAPTSLPGDGNFILHVIQDGSGTRVLNSWNAVFKWPLGVVPVLSTTAGARDVFSFTTEGSTFYGSMLKGMA